MRGERSPYDILGLEPDADLGEIDRAYKRLIKRYHPDRSGGDAARAADVNSAYRELRGPSGPHPLAFHDDDLKGGGGFGWVRAAMLIVLAVALLLVARGPVTAMLRQLSQTAKPEGAQATVRPDGGDEMDRPIRDTIVLNGAKEALRLVRSHDDGALIAASRDCYRRLRVDPSMDGFDHCSAFDDAVVQLQDRDPMSDGGPFSPVAVTGRQWSAAAALSNDYLAVDGRLDRIRIQVEMALASKPPPPPVNSAASEPAQR
jgi:hypothetical protein